ncbi:uncharacterized protein LOC114283839 [Camellia sinensis]|uniref:uncharacterized protein LOC114283839 n=1 Tax=Camellia sinensis TaxID=4442 RepID=UPI001036EF0A|nr:uncharacterized protein LOC114283839 [Camellia sinensis]
MQGFQGGCGLDKWSPPVGDFVKVNFDGATFKNQQSCGVGVIIRAQSGEPIAAFSEQIPTWLEVDCIEALAAVKALEFATELGLTNIHLEGDSLTVVKAIRDESNLCASFGHFLQCAISCTKQFLHFHVSHVRRNGNLMAHHLAQMAKEAPDKRVWLAEVPANLVHILLNDVPIL